MQDIHRINFSWLLRLRRGAIVGQIVVIAVVDGLMRINLPLLPLLVIIGFELASNAACAAWVGRERPVGESTVAIVMIVDVIGLTGLLYFTGGPFNPFSFLYVVQLALAAVVLRPLWTWMLVALSLACFGALFYRHVVLPLDYSDPSLHFQHMTMHLEGMCAAFGVAAVFIVYFVQRVTGALAQRDAELRAARSLSERQDRFAALVTLAAGAAHELATPLSTIAVVAKELEHQLEQADAGGGIADARLIRQEVERCRGILSQMAADAGDSRGEAIVPFTLSGLVEAALRDVPDRGLVRVTVDDDGRWPLRVPQLALARALRGVIRNAQQAASGQTVRLRASAGEHAWRIEVEDHGVGMTPAVRDRAGEPFFSTKAPGGGMGLGLFLTRTVLEHLGGTLHLDSAPGRGTTAVLTIPVGDRLTTDDGVGSAANT